MAEKKFLWMNLGRTDQESFFVAPWRPLQQKLSSRFLTMIQKLVCSLRPPPGEVEGADGGVVEPGVDLVVCDTGIIV